jgi:hypothetical protein
MTTATQPNRTQAAIDRRNALRRAQAAAKRAQRAREADAAAAARREIDWDAAWDRIETFLAELDERYGTDQ